MAYIGKRPVDTFPAINAVTSTLIAENNITAREIATNTIATIEHHAKGTCIKTVFATGPCEISMGIHQKTIQSMKIKTKKVIRVNNLLNIIFFIYILIVTILGKLN